MSTSIIESAIIFLESIDAIGNIKLSIFGDATKKYALLFFSLDIDPTTLGSEPLPNGMLVEYASESI